MFSIARTLKLGVPTLTLLAGLCTLPLHAWNGTGHMTVAGIAYDNLTPQTKAAVDALLMRQKDYGRWMSQRPAGYTDKGRFAFMKAATWPDDVRKTPDDRPLWHFIDVPVYPLLGNGRLPAQANRIYFQTEAEAQAAGYHKSGR